MILTLISSRQVDTPGPSRRSPKCFRNDARTNAKLLQQFTVFRVRSRLDLLRDPTGQEFCYKSPATSSPRPSGRRICLRWNYCVVFTRGSTESMIEPMLYTLTEALVTSLRFALV